MTTRLRYGAAWALIVVSLSLTVTGCVQLYKALGMTEEQAQEEHGKDVEELRKALSEGRVLFWQIVSGVVAAAGALVTGLLAKWLGQEKKIVQAVVAGVEKAGNGKVKEAIHDSALAMGVEGALSKRVQTLT